MHMVVARGASQNEDIHFLDKSMLICTTALLPYIKARGFCFPTWVYVHGFTFNMFSACILLSNSLLLKF